MHFLTTLLHTAMPVQHNPMYACRTYLTAKEIKIASIRQWRLSSTIVFVNSNLSIIYITHMIPFEILTVGGYPAELACINALN